MESPPVLSDPLSPSQNPEGDKNQEYVSLDPRVISLWRFEMAVFYGILIIIASGGCAWAFLVRSPIWPWILIPYFMMLLYHAAKWVWYPPRRFENTGYKLTHEVFEIKRGVWWKTWHLVPLPRLQHADIVSGPMERWYGLATLVIHTAGTHDAVLVIEGLEKSKAIDLRDQLVELGGDKDGF